MKADPRLSIYDGESGGEYDRIWSAMNAGDYIRTTLEREEAVALLGVKNIVENRDSVDFSEKPNAYIFHSLKTPGEVQTLRKIYRERFFLISLYSTKENRKSKLCRKIGDSVNNLRYEDFDKDAQSIIDRDQTGFNPSIENPEKVIGQNVRNTFPAGDIFIDCDNIKDAEHQISRFIDILFGFPFSTPTKDEYAMFHAKAAALRSADLSRQVGAVIATKSGEIIASGCNEVPLHGGGAFWPSSDADESLDNRDYKIGHDPTSKISNEILLEALEKLPSDWLSEKFQKIDKKELVDRALYEGKNPPLKGSKIASILEFGRIVHAEMSAISEAARRGEKLEGATLYCTTFPCHMCARHIIAVGIKRVVFIEPYPKSRAKNLYPKNIKVEGDSEALNDAVSFDSFTGIGPRKFLELFEMPRRKDSRGRVIEWRRDDANLKISGASVAYLMLEDIALEGFDEAIDTIEKKLEDG